MLLATFNNFDAFEWHNYSCNTNIRMLLLVADERSSSCYNKFCDAWRLLYIYFQVNTHTHIHMCMHGIACMTHTQTDTHTCMTHRGDCNRPISDIFRSFWLNV